MKTYKATIIIMAVLSAASMMGCKKNSGSKPISSSSKLSFQLKASSGTNLAGGITTDTIAGLIWTAGTADVSRFSFEAERNGVSIEIESHNLTSINLFALSPIATYVTLDTGTYKEVELKAFFDPSGSDPTPLKLMGTFKNDSSKVVPIEFDLMDSAKIKVEADNITLNGTADYMALVNIALDKLTTGISATDLDKATETGGKIIISKTSNSDLYWKILGNISGCGHSEWREDDHHHND